MVSMTHIKNGGIDMTKQYIGNSLWELSFDSNVKVQMSEDEIKEIMQEFIELSDEFEIAEDKIDSLESDVIKLQDEIKKMEEEIENLRLEI